MAESNPGKPPDANAGKVTFLVDAHFKVGTTKYNFQRGDVHEFTKKDLAHISPDDYVQGVVDLKAQKKK